MGERVCCAPQTTGPPAYVPAGRQPLQSPQEAARMPEAVQVLLTGGDLQGRERAVGRPVPAHPAGTLRLGLPAALGSVPSATPHRTLPHGRRQSVGPGVSTREKPGAGVPGRAGAPPVGPSGVVFRKSELAGYSEWLVSALSRQRQHPGASVLGFLPQHNLFHMHGRKDRDSGCQGSGDPGTSTSNHSRSPPSLVPQDMCPW